MNSAAEDDALGGDGGEDNKGKKKISWGMRTEREMRYGTKTDAVFEKQSHIDEHPNTEVENPERNQLYKNKKKGKALASANNEHMHPVAHGDTALKKDRTIGAGNDRDSEMS